MFLFAHIDSITLPLEDPILKFLLILVIILAAPLLLNKLKIPYLLGLIIAGAVIGPHGLNLVLRDSSIILSGTAGLLYIMFLSGLDMDMSDSKKQLAQPHLRLYTFCVPLGLGILAGYYILGFPDLLLDPAGRALRLATLIAYPIVSKLGISRDKAVTIAVGGMVITDTLALLLLTVIVGMATGNVDETFWWRLSASVLLSIGIILFLFPAAGALVFQTLQRQRIAVYLRAGDGIPGSLSRAHGRAGADHRCIPLRVGPQPPDPRTSPLMNRIEFVGNAIFIPFFLIGVGMLIDYRAFFRDWESIRSGAGDDRPDYAREIPRGLFHAKDLPALERPAYGDLRAEQRPCGGDARGRHGRLQRHTRAYGGRRTNPPAERKRPERHDPDDPRHLHRLDLRHATGAHTTSQCAMRRTTTRSRRRKTIS